MIRWIRRPPEKAETAGAALVAGAVALAAGALAFYVTRLLLARDPLEGPGEGTEAPGRLRAGGDPSRVGGGEA